MKYATLLSLFRPNSKIISLMLVNILPIFILPSVTKNPMQGVKNKTDLKHE
jgi:hypothetical protein